MPPAGPDNCVGVQKAQRRRFAAQPFLRAGKPFFRPGKQPFTENVQGKAAPQGLKEAHSTINIHGLAGNS